MIAQGDRLEGEDALSPVAGNDGSLTISYSVITNAAGEYLIQLLSNESYVEVLIRPGTPFFFSIISVY